MPPKKAAQSKAAPKKAAPKAKNGPRGMAKSIAPGLVMTDLMKKQWKLGPVIGQGGFGYIYLGDSASSGSVTTANASNVIKVEPHANGPLFVELAFYQRVAKADMINTWAKANKKKHVGIPVYIGTGSFENDGTKYRFMVMDRFGTDVEKLYKECNYIFPEKTVYSLGLRILDTLEYIHDKEYVHADIKSSNLMMGHKPANKRKMFLLDYGLAYRYCPGGKHVAYKEDPKRKHDGTIEYTSRDAHKGLAPSRRGDMEILAYCMIQWLCKKLPWENKLSDKDYVAKQKFKKKVLHKTLTSKIRYMDDIPAFMKECFGQTKHSQIETYLKLVTKLDYDERPDYNAVRKIFTDGLKNAGSTDDGTSVCLPSASSPRKRGRASIVEENSPSPKKRGRPSSNAASKNSPPRRRRSNSSTGARSPSKRPANKSPTKNKRSPARKQSPVRKTNRARSTSRTRSKSPSSRATKANRARSTSRDGSKPNRTRSKSPSSRATKAESSAKVKIVRSANSNAALANGRTVHRRPRRKNVPTRNFAQSP